MDDQKTFAALKCLINEQKFALGVNLTNANSAGVPWVSRLRKPVGNVGNDCRCRPRLH